MTLGGRGRARGGVSPKAATSFFAADPDRRWLVPGIGPTPEASLSLGDDGVAAPRSSGTPSVAYPGFTYHGGPVLACPIVLTSFWGSLWREDETHRQRARDLSQFHADLLQSAFMNVLSQYGVGFGAGTAGAFVRATYLRDVPPTLTDGNVQEIIRTGVAAGAFPTLGETALVIYLDEATTVNDPAAGVVFCEPTSDTAFGYHHVARVGGELLPYAVIPSLSDQCLVESRCGPGARGSLALATEPLQRLTLVASHHFAELTTNPFLNAWFDDDTGAEVGDVCNGEADVVTVDGNGWTVQRQYSKYADQTTQGAVFGSAMAAKPLPRLSPGPTPAPATLGYVLHLSFDERLLPLPSAEVDLAAGTLTLDASEVRAYARRVFDPLWSHHVITDLTTFLRQLAESLEPRSERHPA